MLKQQRTIDRKAARGMKGIAVFCLGLALCACKTWYKQGADTDELDIEQRKCEALTGTDSGAAFDDCMAEAGWHNTTMSVTSVEPDDDNSGDDDSVPTPGRQAPTGDEGPPAAVDTVGSTAPRQTNGKEQAQASPSWFQLGADADDLKEEQAACKAGATGAASLERCMRNKGWQPIDARMSTD
jgi:hypothetical protein